MRFLLRLVGLAWKQVARHRLRTLLTVAGVASGMFLYAAVETMQHSLRAATAQGAGDNTLVVYRESRFCPATSRLPEHYAQEIRRIPGVRDAIPVQIVVNHCGASLDVIVFRGVPPEELRTFNPGLEIVEGSYEDWVRQSDGALVGAHFAARRGLRAGDTFEAVGVRVRVAGVVRSPEAQDNSVAYVHLPFLQQASRSGLGVVTQFTVRVDDPAALEEVARRIDERFASDPEPTETRPEKAFFAEAARGMVELIAFTRWLGAGAICAVLALVANALLLTARTRVRENAILGTIGFSRAAVGVVVMCEGLLLGLAGGAVGSAAAAAFFHWRRFTFGNEGLTLALTPSAGVTLAAMGFAILLGLLASLWPAWIAARRPVVESLRRA